MKPKRIRVAEPCLGGNEAQYVQKCIEDTWISSRGEYVDRFEEMLAKECGVKHAVVTNNGTTALHLALVACGIQQDDEVLMPTLTYVATANAVKYCNATPVFVDSEPVHLNVDVSKLEQAITDRTRAIVTVPLYGHPVDIDPIRAIAAKHGLMVIEDSAESLGASYRGRPVGSLAECSTFSFFGNKLITTGEGGAVVTDNEQLARRMKFLRGQAVDPNRSYWHPEVGFNYRMTNVAAAIGVAQMERISDYLERRRQVAALYSERLRGSVELLQLPSEASWAKHSYWMYTVLLLPNLGIVREQLMAELEAQGIETRPVFYPVHWMPAYRDCGGYFPVADDCSARGLSLPTHANLSESDVDCICESLIQAIRRFRDQNTKTTRMAA